MPFFTDSPSDASASAASAASRRRFLSSATCMRISFSASSISAKLASNASRTAAHAKHASQSVFRIIALVGHGSSE